jgi:hypothetical protein
MCECCNEAREAPQYHRFFADGCLHCAARRIQYIQRRLPLSLDDKRNRCRTALAQAMELGLPEQEIRAMAKLAAWQVAPPEAIQQPASSNVQRKHGR